MNKSLTPNGSPGSLTTIVDDQGEVVSFSTAAPDQWVPIADPILHEDGKYQVLFAPGTALKGAYITNTSEPGTGPVYVDVTGATGTELSIAAMPIYPAMSAEGAPGAWRMPPCKGAVTIMGPKGSTVRGFSA